MSIVFARFLKVRLCDLRVSCRGWRRRGRDCPSWREFAAG